MDKPKQPVRDSVSKDKVGVREMTQWEKGLLNKHGDQNSWKKLGSRYTLVIPTLEDGEKRMQGIPWPHSLAN